MAGGQAGRGGEIVADRVEGPRIGARRRPRVEADRRRVDLDDLAQRAERERLDVRRQGSAGQRGAGGRDQAVEHERGLPGAGRPGQRGEPADRERGADVVQVVEATHGDLDRGGVQWPGRAGHRRAAGQIGPDDRPAVSHQGRGSPGRDDRAAQATRARAHLDHPVGGPHDVEIVLDDHHRIAVGGQRGDRFAQAFDIAGMQTNRRFVQQIEHAGRVGPHGRGQLDALPLAGRERRPGPVEAEIAESQFQPGRNRSVQFAEQAGRHLLQGRRHQWRKGRSEGHQVIEGKGVDLAHGTAARPPEKVTTCLTGLPFITRSFSSRDRSA